LLAEILRQRGARAPVVTLANGGPPPAPAIPLESRYGIVYAGLFRRIKDFELLFEAAARLPSSLEIEVWGGDEEGARATAVRLEADRRAVRRQAALPAPVPSPVASGGSSPIAACSSCHRHLCRQHQHAPICQPLETIGISRRWSPIGVHRPSHGAGPHRT
jgi:hypothetical protein